MAAIAAAIAAVDVLLRATAVGDVLLRATAVADVLLPAAVILLRAATAVDPHMAADLRTEADRRTAGALDTEDSRPTRTGL